LTDGAVAVSDLSHLSEGWLLDCQYRRLSDATVHTRRLLMQKLLWWFDHVGITICGTAELKAFLTYVSTGHEEPGGRWGNPRLSKPVRPRTVKDFHTTLRTFFRWLVEEDAIAVSPMERIRAPISRADQIQPFSEDQVLALLGAARRSDHPKRDEAIVLFLLDALVRASELCHISIEDIDLAGRTARVYGKGGKWRQVYFGATTGRALWKMLAGARREPQDPLFVSERGGRLTRSGLQQIIERLGLAARIEAVRCSAHTFRHTGALLFLSQRGGAPAGNVFALQALLGHTDLQMTRRYLQLAQADVQAQHLVSSPVERLKRTPR
jgi:integrase/recombinase XerD